MPDRVVKIHIVRQAAIHIADKRQERCESDPACDPDLFLPAGFIVEHAVRAFDDRVRAFFQLCEQVTCEIATGFDRQAQHILPGALEMVKGWDSLRSLSSGKRTNRNCPARCFLIGSLLARRVTSVLELLGCFTASTL